MNGPIRQGMIPQSAQQNMLSTSFMQSPQNIPANAPHMGMLSAAPVPVQRYPMQPNPMQQPLQQQQQQQQHQQHQQQQQQQQRPMIPRNPSANPHLQSQLQGLQGLAFPPNIAANSNIRRVHSQPHMNPLGVLPASMSGSMSMGMNPQPGIPGQLRQLPAGQQNPQQQLHQLRLQQQQQQQQQQLQHHHHQQQQQQQPMVQQPTMSDLILRNQAAGNQPMQPNIGPRMSSAQGQVMSSLTQPAPGMQPPNSFPNGSMQQSQLSTSPRPNSRPGMTMSSTPGSSINRMRTSPDNSNSMSFLNYPVSQFSANNPGRGVPPSPSPSSYPYVTSTSPPMQLSDISQTSPPGMMATQGGTPSNKGFFPTPAQQQLDMSVDMYNQSFSMPPPASIPSQTPSSSSLQQPSSAPHPPSMPIPQQQQQRPPPPPQPSPGPHQQHHHQLAHQLQNELNQGPPSQQQHQRQGAQQQQQQIGGILTTPSSGSSSSQPPRGPIMPTAAFSAGLTAAGRIPPSQQQVQRPILPPQPPPQQQQQHQQQPLMPIAPRPPGGGAGPQAGPALPPPPPPPPLAPTSSGGGAAQSGPTVSTTTTTTSPPPSSATGGDQAGGRGRMIPSRSSTSPSNLINDKVGKGQGLMRLLQFSGILSNENRQKHELSFWNDVVKEYFTPRALMKLTLWKDNQRNEAKPFEIGVPILPRFFLVTTQSGVRTMTLALDGARERLQTTGHAIVECVGAVWTYRYTNGYTVTLRGPLTAHVVATLKSPPGGNSSKDADVTLKFDEFQFDANYHDKFIALESVLGSRSIESFPMPATPMMLTAPSPSSSTGVGLAGFGLSAQQQQQQQAEEERRWEEPRVLIDHASIPGEPINAFGIPQATMRCLELAESVTSMTELIQFAKETTFGPRDALKEFAHKLRESGALPGPPLQHPPPPPSHAHPMNMNNPQQQQQFHHPSTPSSASTTTLYSSVSPSTTHSAPPGSTMNSPPNTTSSAMNSPEKQPKTIPQQHQHHQHHHHHHLQHQQHQHQQQNQVAPSAPPSTSPRMSSSSTTTTMTTTSSSNNNNNNNNTNAPLKRKQTGDSSSSSPTMGNNEHPPKRQPRKRGRTGTGGPG